MISATGPEAGSGVNQVIIGRFLGWIYLHHRRRWPQRHMKSWQAVADRAAGR